MYATAVGRSALAAALVSLAAPAQQRFPAFANVVAAAGVALAGARVVWVGSPVLPAAEPEPAVADVVEAVADPRGRCVGRLLSGREYSAWAVTGLAADGTFRVSAIGHGLRGGSIVDLALGEPRRRQRAVLKGTEVWADLAPLRIARVVLGRHVLPIVPDAEGLLPAMPEVSRFVIVDREGVVLWDGPPSPDPLDQRHVFVPAPRRAEVVVRDERNQPLAGAEIWLQYERRSPFRDSQVQEGWHFPAIPGWSRRLGASDAQGCVTVVLPAWTDDLHWYLQARAAGRERVSFGIDGSRILFVGKVTELAGTSRRFEVTLGPGASVAIEPPGERRLELFTNADAGNRNKTATATVAVDREGRVTAPFRLEPRWGVVARELGPPDATPTLGLARHTEGSWRIDLNGRRVRLAVHGEHAALARPVRLLLFPLVSDSTALELSLPLDAAGKSEVRLARGQWMLWACDGVHSATRVLRIEDADEDVRLDLQPIATATLKFVLPDGKPAAGRPFRFGTWMRSRGTDSLEVRALQPRTTLLWPGSHGEVKLDEGGRVRFPLLVPEAEVRINFDPTATGEAERIRLEPGEIELPYGGGS